MFARLHACLRDRPLVRSLLRRGKLCTVRSQANLAGYRLSGSGARGSRPNFIFEENRVIWVSRPSHSSCAPPEPPTKRRGGVVDCDGCRHGLEQQHEYRILDATLGEPNTSSELKCSKRRLTPRHCAKSVSWSLATTLKKGSTLLKPKLYT